jgi:hypothetical protein
MKTPNRATAAFAGSHFMKSRRALQALANDPTAGRKIVKELQRIQNGKGLTGKGRDLLMQYATQQLTGMLANKIGGVISGDRASIPPEFIGAGDPNDGLNLLTTFTTSGPKVPNNRGNNGVEAINVKTYKYKTYVNPTSRFRQAPIKTSLNRSLNALVHMT